MGSKELFTVFLAVAPRRKCSSHALQLSHHCTTRGLTSTSLIVLNCIKASRFGVRGTPKRLQAGFRTVFPPGSNSPVTILLSISSLSL
jgi:hypothetical protein